MAIGNFNKFVLPKENIPPDNYRGDLMSEASNLAISSTATATSLHPLPSALSPLLLHRLCQVLLPQASLRENPGRSFSSRIQFGSTFRPKLSAISAYCVLPTLILLLLLPISSSLLRLFALSPPRSMLHAPCSI